MKRVLPRSSVGCHHQCRLCCHDPSSGGASRTDFSDVQEKEYPEVNVIVKNSLGRIRDLEIHPLNGKIYTVNRKFLWLIEKKINH